MGKKEVTIRFLASNGSLLGTHKSSGDEASQAASAALENTFKADKAKAVVKDFSMTIDVTVA